MFRTQCVGFDCCQHDMTWCSAHAATCQPSGKGCLHAQGQHNNDACMRARLRAYPACCVCMCVFCRHVLLS